LKVIHLPYGIGISALSQALRTQGIDATSCSLRNHHYAYMADIRMHFDPSEKGDELRTAFFMEAVKKYDIFHFHFGETFFPDRRDLDIIKNYGKKMVVNHRGSEVRMLSVARSFNNPYVHVKRSWTDEKKIHANLKLLSTYIDHSIVNDFELSPYVEPYYKKIHVLPHAIDADQFQPHYPSEDFRPLIVHAPSRREIKGTEFVLAAVERLTKKGFNFDFRLIEGLPHTEALKLYQQAAIVIDQLQIGAYGHLSVEAMAMGKPTVCFIREDLRNSYPSDLPIVSANPETIYDVLKNQLRHPERWKRLGEQGRIYVRNHHNLDKVAQKLIKIYKEL